MTVNSLTTIDDNDCDAVSEYAELLDQVCSEVAKRGTKIYPGGDSVPGTTCPMLAWATDKPISSSQFWSFVDGFDGNPSHWAMSFNTQLTFSKVFYDLGTSFREKALSEGF